MSRSCIGRNLRRNKSRILVAVPLVFLSVGQTVGNGLLVQGASNQKAAAETPDAMVPGGDAAEALKSVRAGYEAAAHDAAPPDAAPPDAAAHGTAAHGKAAHKPASHATTDVVQGDQRDQQTERLLDRIKSNYEFLLEKWKLDPNSPVPKAYLDNLTSDGTLLSRAVADRRRKVVSSRRRKVKPKPGEVEAIPEIGEARRKKPVAFQAALKDVAEDLEIKANHCRLSTGGWATLVDVTVNTKQGDQVVGGMQVWYVPKGWAGHPDKWLPFSRFSSPTDEHLPPGNYMMRVNQGSPEQRRVGGDGKDTQVIDIRVN